MQHLILIKKLKLFFLLLLNDANTVYISRCLKKTYSTGSHCEHFFLPCYTSASHLTLLQNPTGTDFFCFVFFNVVYCYAEYFPMTALRFCICAFCSLAPVYWAITTAPNKMCILLFFVLSKIC